MSSSLAKNLPFDWPVTSNTIREFDLGSFYLLYLRRRRRRAGFRLSKDAVSFISYVVMRRHSASARVELRCFDVRLDWNPRPRLAAASASSSVCLAWKQLTLTLTLTLASWGLSRRLF